MKKYNDVGSEEMLEWSRMNGINMSEGQAKDIVKEDKAVDFDEWMRQNNMTPIGEYEKLTDRMKRKVEKIISSLNEEREKALDIQDERDEDDTLDEKDGKEELSEDKKEEAKEKQREKAKENPEGQEDDSEEKDKKEEEKKKDKEEELTAEEKKEGPPKKDEYLANLKKLHDMKIRDYKRQMTKDDTRIGANFVAMMYLQKRLNRQRAAFIKEYGSEELTKLENEYLKEENKYEKTLTIRMQKDLTKLRQLDEKLDSILDRMQMLQKRIEDGSISLEEYNDEINILEKDKLDTLWQISRLNPQLLQEKQENLQLRDKIEKKTTNSRIDKARKKDMTPENKAKTGALNYEKNKQDGVAEKTHKNIKQIMEDNINARERKLDEMRKELKGIDITTPDGKKRAMTLIGEIQSLEAQKMSDEMQLKNLEKNMQTDSKNYSDLKDSETKREDNTEKFEEFTSNINHEDTSNDLMYQLKSQALEDPSTPEQAQEFIDNINEVAEEAEKNQDDKQKQSDETEPPTLWNRRKRYGSNN